MLQELNLLNSFPKIKRDVKARTTNKLENRKLALKFDKEYFDGTREQGYGGYKYDGRWIEVSQKLQNIFNLKDNSKILDIGCAKGFLLYDLKNLNKTFKLHGIDVSNYAKENSIPTIKNNIKISSCETLDYPDNYFDCVVAINTVHNLDYNKCFKSIKEIQRVSGGKAFIQVDAYRNDKELDLFKDWMLTAKTYLKPKEWIDMFNKASYTGYYYWTILEL
tara:strand:- start:325 stop:984 length:660 start_codon:yes stop_codon:yes gene_type:complete